MITNPVFQEKLNKYYSSAEAFKRSKQAFRLMAVNFLLFFVKKYFSLKVTASFEFNNVIWYVNRI